MQQSPDFAGTIWQALTVLITFLWNWSFGQVVTMFQMPFNTLPLWKQVLFVIVIASLAHLSYKVAKSLRNAALSLVGATVGMISVFPSMVPQIAWAGLIAFGGAWAIMNLDPEWIPAGLR
jgi:hypothetical protein